MPTVNSFENYPIRIVLISNVVSLLIYSIGIFILFKLDWIVAAFYLTYVFILEFRVIRYHCINCYYWGKTCGFAKGRISSLFFKKGNETKFCTKEMKWVDMIPDLLVFLIPFVSAIILLFLQFQIILLVALLLLTVLSTSITGFVRGNLTCKHCKQREIGCPAEQLFNKKNQ